METTNSQDKVTTVRLRSADYARLQALADREARSMASVIILAIREKYERDIEAKE